MFKQTHSPFYLYSKFLLGFSENLTFLEKYFFIYRGKHLNNTKGVNCFICSINIARYIYISCGHEKIHVHVCLYTCVQVHVYMQRLVIIVYYGPQCSSSLLFLLIVFLILQYSYVIPLLFLPPNHLVYINYCYMIVCKCIRTHVNVDSLSTIDGAVW